MLLILLDQHMGSAEGLLAVFGPASLWPTLDIADHALGPLYDLVQLNVG